MTRTVIVATDLWLWLADDHRWHLGAAPDNYPGARVPRPHVIKAGTEVDLTVWRADCPGCEALRAFDQATGEIVTVEHTHGAP